MNIQNKKWSMPKWMEEYRSFICNTCGNKIEELMNNHTTTIENNAVLALLCVAVKSQVKLLQILKKNKKI